MDKSTLKDILELLGVTASSVLASFMGGIVGLAFLRGLTPVQVVVTIVSGLGLGSYGGAALVAYLNLPAPTAGVLSFLGGVLAMPLLGMAFAVISRIRNKPEALLPMLKDTSEKPPEEPKP